MEEFLEDITGKVALVTGASSGIGQAIACRLSNAGAEVAGLGRSTAGLSETGALIEEWGGSFLPIESDLAVAGSLEAGIESVVSSLGKIDILINNAGVMYTHNPGVTDRPRWTTMLQINLMSVIEGCEAAIKHMRKAAVDGRIVNVTSLASRAPGGGIYGASKLAVEKYTDELRSSLENDSIRVTTIVPGGFSTNLGRDLAPEEQQAFGSRMGQALSKDEPDADGRTPHFGIPDDIARAVLYAVAQPAYANVSEMVVRPIKNIDPDAFLV